eukprot:TRINITY_DN43441_c0_g2_i4.p1 TRINITY_DN43441_c0_g2~~TRINITY_DN43441_c0_g2_i4.p1  ORF type:complete len:237 (-),score=34.25 TRINITY_DN43441_c0_g2_i4:60-719(-)
MPDLWKQRRRHASCITFSILALLIVTPTLADLTNPVEDTQTVVGVVEAPFVAAEAVGEGVVLTGEAVVSGVEAAVGAGEAVVAGGEAVVSGVEAAVGAGEAVVAGGEAAVSGVEAGGEAVVAGGEAAVSGVEAGGEAVVAGGEAAAGRVGAEKVLASGGESSSFAGPAGVEKALAGEGESSGFAGVFLKFPVHCTLGYVMLQECVSSSAWLNSISWSVR